MTSTLKSPSNQSRLLPLFGIMLMTVMIGCEPQRTRRSIGQRQVAEDVDRNFENAMGILRRAEEFEMALAHQRSLYLIQRWIDKQADSATWIADSLADRIPNKFKIGTDIDELALRRFQSFDILVLQEAVWLRNVAANVDTRPSTDPSIQFWLEGLKKPEHRAEVERALKLFDWVVRNIQLDEPRLISVPPEEISRNDAEKKTEKDAAPKEETIREAWYAWENLMLGHSTAEERARMFILMARQVGIDVVALGIDENSKTRFWLAACKIGKELYLFDPRLGMPIPGPEGKGIATLNDIRADASILRALDVDDLKYPVTADDVKNVSAMVDATPAYLSQRMALVEQQLSGEQRLVLTCKPSETQKALRDDCKISNVRIWMLPYEGFRFRRAMIADQMNAAKENRGLKYGMTLLNEHQLFASRTPMSQGRILQFAGRFDSFENLKGAKHLYTEGRATKSQLEDLQTDKAKETLKLVLGVEKLPEKMDLKPLVNVLTKTKQYGSYWIGQMLLDTENFESAIDWFKTRTLDAFDEGMFRQGASYNLGRCYESIGRKSGDDKMLKAAQDSYRSIADSPQHHGNLLRAKMLDE